MTQLIARPSQGPSPGANAGNGQSVVTRRLDPNALASDSATLKGLLESSRDKMALVIPKHLNPERLIRVALVAVSRSELLQKCTTGSILRCVMTGAQLGLDCSGVLGSAYMVPFRNNKSGVYEATFIPGYRGLIDLARRSGEIEDISANVVYQDDAFEFELGAVPKLVHKPNFQAERHDQDIVGAYMVAFLKGNPRPHLEFMSRGQLENIRNSSKGYLKDEWANGRRTGRQTPQGPWHDHFAEMCRKTVVRRGVKYLPMSVELMEAVQLADNEFDPSAPPVVSASTQAVANNAAALNSMLDGGRILDTSTSQAPLALESSSSAEPFDADSNHDQVEESLEQESASDVPQPAQPKASQQPSPAAAAARAPKSTAYAAPAEPLPAQTVHQTPAMPAPQPAATVNDDPLGDSDPNLPTVARMGAMGGFAERKEAILSAFKKMRSAVGPKQASRDFAGAWFKWKPASVNEADIPVEHLAELYDAIVDNRWNVTTGKVSPAT